MDKYKICTILVISAVLLLILLSIYLLRQKNYSITGQEIRLFSDILLERKSHPQELWATINLDRFHHSLKNSRNRYRVINSKGEIIYDNRFERYGSDNIRESSNNRLTNNYEYIEAISLGESYISRDKMRYHAFSVTTEDGDKRVIHITSSGI